MESEGAVVRFYTAARKIPFLVGKFGDFTVPGGPYTLTQVLVAAGVAWVGSKSVPLWIGDAPVVFGWVPVLLIAAISGYAVGRIPLKGRNPLMIIWGIFGYAAAPAWGSRGGKSVALPSTRRIKYRFSALEPFESEEASDAQEPEEEAPEAVQEAEDADTPEIPQPVGVADGQLLAPRRHQLTEVQQILAASAQRR